LKYLPLFFISFFVAFFGVWFIRRLAFQKNWHITPSSDRWHKTPTVLFGGVGFAPVIIIFQIYIIVSHSISIPLLGIILIVGTLSMFFLGLIDDIWPIGPIKKLLTQVVVAGLFIHSGGVFNLSSYDLLDIFISYLWFIVIINSLNMLDNMDGLAAGIACLSIIFLIIISIPSSGSDPLIIPFGIIILATLIAFLLFNYNPASIFMGDSGSLSLGFALAALTIPSELNFNFGLSINSKINTYIFFLIPLALLSVQIFDFVFVTINRLIKGKKPYIGGRDHTSHTLVKLGMSDKKAVFFLYVLCILGGSVAVGIKFYKFDAIIFFVSYFFVLMVLAIYLSLKANTK
jgi:UDP-GlcNAc:undecaprenyl-phosphate/decaprenyl-phosphate GlcNAc-1-phosphate transferase